eukprot:GILJ01011707.1.p1 GENE.GILJ01011707.1~~GILJ01011707.1.p1  ORF type:complete len:377 (-),score=40.79 GILJ01011707.1:33-1136(-)
MAAQEAEDDMEVFDNMISSLSNYKRASLHVLLKSIALFKSRLTNDDLSKFFPSFAERFSKQKEAINTNVAFLDLILTPALEPRGAATTREVNSAPANGTSNGSHHHHDSGADKRQQQNLVHNIFKQMFRDWSEAGKEERKVSIDLIVEKLKQYTPPLPTTRVLVPGMGLGRLLWEIGRQGYTTQGNELSYYMLLPANHILNRCRTVEEFTICPWVHDSANQWTLEQRISSVKIPDVDVNAFRSQLKISVTAGDFVEVYSDSEHISSWDAVTTCFFLDTGISIIEYMKTIHTVLVAGGIWVNCGPLYYHFDDSKEGTLDLTYEELRHCLDVIGFDLLEEQQIRSSFTSQPNSMMELTYNCAFFVAKKR